MKEPDAPKLVGEAVEQRFLQQLRPKLGFLPVFRLIRCLLYTSVACVVYDLDLYVGQVCVCIVPAGCKDQQRISNFRPVENLDNLFGI